MYQAKDFIETAEGLIFAVVAGGRETGKIRCFLRYIYLDDQWRKVASEQANHFLAEGHPQYLFHSLELDARLHAVAESAIVKHYSPRLMLQRLLQCTACDQVQADLQQLCGYLQRDGVDFDHLGITGSLLVGLQNPASDIDLVCYDRKAFHQLRHRIQGLIAQGKCHPLNDGDWLEAYQRRACWDLSLDEYIRHELRKYNKALINQRKFDLSLLAAPRQKSGKHFRKLGAIRLEARVVDDGYGFDYPAEFVIDHPEITSIASFTATYTGQAQAGERVLVAGQLEQDEHGVKRIVVGSSREAAGEFIKVLQ